MGNEEVNIKMTGDSERAVTAIEKIAESFDKLANKSRVAGSDGGSALDGITDRVAGVAAGMLSATALVSSFAESWKQVRQEADNASQAIDASMRKLAVQSGRLDAGDKKRVESAALKYALGSIDQAAAVSTKLISTGFSSADATGGALDVSLATGVATNAQDQAQNAEALSMFLAATKQAKTPENLKKVGVQFQTLFRGTNIQAPDIAEIASSAAAETAMHAAPQDIMPVFSLLREVMPGADAKTGLKNVMLNLGAASASKEKIAALRSLGLKPGDVDFHEGNMQQTLERFKGGFDSAAPQVQTVALEKIFGHRGVGAMAALMANLDKLPGRLGPGDEAGFNNAVQIGTTGVAAENRRAEIRNQMASDDRTDWQGLALVRKELKTSLTNQGIGEWELAGQMQGFDINSKFQSARSAAERATTGNLLFGNKDYSKDLNDPNSPLVQALNKIEENTRPRETKITGIGDTQPARSEASTAGQR